jgi:putative sigma-54 modulation protein
MEVTEAMKSFAEAKVNKLLKYYDRIQEIEVVFDKGSAHTNEMQVEVIVNAEHKKEFIAHHSHADAYACVDGCVDKLERQLSEHKKVGPQPQTPEGGSDASIRHGDEVTR